MSKIKERAIKDQTIDEHRAVVTTEAAQLVPRPAQTKNAFEAYADGVAPETIVGELLKFSKGDLVAGKDNRPVPFGICYVANMDAMLGGWVKWKGGKPVAHALVRIADGLLPPERETLGDLDEDAWEVDSDGRPRNPWQKINYLVLADPEGKLFTFAISGSGLREVGALARAYARHADKSAFPLIKISCGSYQHSDRSIGRVKFPEVNIDGWAPKEKFFGTASELPAKPASKAVTSTADANEPPAHDDVEEQGEPVPF